MLGLRYRLIASAVGLVLLSAVVTAVTPAQAVSFGFNQITDNSPNFGTQLFVDVTAEGTTGARFTFSNNGPVASSITDIYFINSTGLFNGITGIVNGTGVDFSSGASPPQLPGYNVDAAFAADSDPPAQPNGVNPGETLAIVLALLGSDFGGVLSALFAGTLKIGLHVQGIGPDSVSNSYLATTPLPGALPLFATGLVWLGWLRRQKMRKLGTA